MTEKNYGLHITIDGYRGDKKRLGDVNHMYQFLHDLPAHVGMNKVGFPQIIQEGKVEDLVGISGFQFIIESHISMHTYAEEGFLSFDLYSCKEFETDIVEKLLTEAYDLKDLEINIVKRGNCFADYCVDREVISKSTHKK